MCLGIPGKVIKIEKHKATIQYSDETREVLVGDEKIKVSDYVLVQMGIIVKILSKQEVELLTISVDQFLSQ